MAGLADNGPWRERRSDAMVKNMSQNITLELDATAAMLLSMYTTMTQSDDARRKRAIAARHSTWHDTQKQTWWDTHWFTSAQRTSAQRNCAGSPCGASMKRTFTPRVFFPIRVTSPAGRTVSCPSKTTWTKKLSSHRRR